jgi:aminopeptidase
VQRIERASEINAAAVGISSGSDAALFADLDPGRLARARPLAYTRAWLAGALGGHLSWSLVGYPTPEWAREIFGEPDVERLWDAVAHALRLDEEDPAAAWQARAGELEQRGAVLTERRFDAIRYRGPGTDLEVGLIHGHVWKGGRERTVTGQVHIANLPTEEVFTSPHRLRAEGSLRASVPFDLRGTMVEGLELRFAGGRIVDVRADHGAEAVRSDLATDDGASHLGEVALVDGTSRVGETGVTFHNTLFDENARSHVAWGTGFGFSLPDVPEAEHAERGLNSSSTHIDFMIGRDELEIDGVEADGTAVPILRGGAWQLTG